MYRKISDAAINETDLTLYMEWDGYYYKRYDYDYDYKALFYLDSISDTTYPGYPYRYKICTGYYGHVNDYLYAKNILSIRYSPVCRLDEGTDPSQYESEPDCILVKQGTGIASFSTHMNNNMTKGNINNNKKDYIYDNKIYRYFDLGENSNYTYKAYSTNKDDHSNGQLYYITQNISDLKYNTNEHDISITLYKNTQESENTTICVISPDNEEIVFRNLYIDVEAADPVNPSIIVYRAPEYDSNELPVTVTLTIKCSNGTSTGSNWKTIKVSAQKGITLRELLTTSSTINNIVENQIFKLGYRPDNNDHTMYTFYAQELTGYSLTGLAADIVNLDTYIINSDVTLYAMYDFIVPTTYSVNVTFGVDSNWSSTYELYGVMRSFESDSIGTVNSGSYLGQTTLRDFTFGLEKPKASKNPWCSQFDTCYSGGVDGRLFGLWNLTITLNGKTATLPVAIPFTWPEQIKYEVDSQREHYSHHLEDYFTQSDFTGTKTITFTFSKM